MEKHLSESEIIAEYIKSKNNIIYFATNYVKIKTTDRKKIDKYNSSLVPFEPYPYQRIALKLFSLHRYCVVLKPRQMGITTLMCLYVLWLALFHDHKDILVVTIKNKVAKDMLKRIKDMYRSLPAWLKVKVINGRGEVDLGNSTTMEFSNGSRITVVPNTADAGRSGTYNVVISDETAFQKYAKDIWTSIQPAIEADGQIIMCSTAFGYNFFQGIWQGAVQKINGFFPIFLNWRQHPNRTDAWYQEQIEKLGKIRVAQEIDCEFAQSGYNVMDIEIVKEYELENLTNKPTKILSGRGYSFGSPILGENYYIGADISTGRSRDGSAYCVMDTQGNVMETFWARIDPTSFGALLHERGVYWNNAVLAPENNSYGQAVVTYLQMVEYPNIFVMRTPVKKVGDKKVLPSKVYGWTTSSKSRDLLITTLADDFNNGTLEIFCPYFLKECYTFVYNDRNKAVALGKDTTDGDDVSDEGAGGAIYTDDMIIATGITNAVRLWYRKEKKYSHKIAS